MKVLDRIKEQSRKRKKQFAILVDPDKTNAASLQELCCVASDSAVDYFFVGGSLLVSDSLSRCIGFIREHSSLPVVLFPGNALQIDRQADAILFLSLISGRNPELLIGKHVAAAPLIREYELEAVPTGYMLIDGGNLTSVQYISDTRPIPHDKDDIAAYTALAGEMLGLQCIFMDAGSGAQRPVSEAMIGAVKKQITLPLIIGGGIRTPGQAVAVARAGADVVVVGNSIEKEASLATEISRALHAV